MLKVLYTLLALVCLSGAAIAAPGDTTWVQATNRRFDNGSGYGAYDTTVSFPTGTASYRKIYMIFTLGKYACPGYNPSNAGEGPGQTGWCGDWDYTVQNFLMTPGGDTLELGRLITPYANHNFPRTPLNWERRYIFDVTDYYPLLKNNAAFRVFYSGYSAGFRGNVKFAFIEGTPERPVLRIDRLWHKSYNYGHGATPINAALGTLSLTAPAGTQSAELKMNITGHGGDDNACAEFCPNIYTLALNGSPLVQQPFFRSDCSENDLYPQSGTWVYSRAGWCPGDLVKTFSHPLTGLSGGNAYNVGMTFPAYTSTGGFLASYTIAGAVMYYGAPAHSVDASLEDIIAPTDAEFHWRQNPTSLQPKLRVRNSGSTAITALSFSYGVQGKLTNTYSWTGNIPPYQTVDVVLPAIAQLRLLPGVYGFSATIASANGVTDGDALNNSLSSTFTAAPSWPSEFLMQLRASEGHPNNPAVSATAWRIEDATGNVVSARMDCPVGVICTDTVRLSGSGAYRLIVTDTIAYGFYDNVAGRAVGILQGNGNTGGIVRAIDVATSLPITTPGNFNGNFGAGFIQHFYTGAPLSVPVQKAGTGLLRVFPNPASSAIHVFVDGISAPAGEVTVQDMFGRTVSRQAYRGTMLQIDASNLANGLYQVLFHADGTRLQQRVLVAR